MSMPRKVTIVCPHCREGQEIVVWETLNSMDELARQKVLSQEFFFIKCKACGVETNLQYPMIYHDMRAKFMVSVEHPDALKPVPVHGSEANNIFSGYRWRKVSTTWQLVEKISAFEGALDDRVLEILKVRLVAGLVSRHGEMLTKLKLVPFNVGQLFFVKCERASQNSNDSPVLIFAILTADAIIQVLLLRVRFPEYTQAGKMMRNTTLDQKSWHAIDYNWARANIADIDSPAEFELTYDPVAVIQEPILQGIIRKRKLSSGRRENSGSARREQAPNQEKATRDRSADEDLSYALVHLLRDRGSKAIEMASRWVQLPEAKCIIFLTYSFRFYEALKAAEVFGGTASLVKMMETKGYEECFLKGYGALFKQQTDVALGIFKSNPQFSERDPFILFGIGVAEVMKSNSLGVLKALATMERAAPCHPLIARFKEEFV